VGKVTINELALGNLLSSREGPVGQDIERRAQHVVELAKEHIRFVMHRDPSWDDVVDYQMEFDVVAVIGFRDSPPSKDGPTYTYFGNKEIREGRFLERALREGYEG
jgi:hypothetical protein